MAKISVGLDIGFSSIKMVALSFSGDLPKLTAIGSIPTPQPGLVSDTDIELEAVAASIKKLLATAKIDVKEVNAALPESKVFTRVIDDLPYLSDAELQPAIQYASEEFIPMPIADVNLNWQVISRTNDKEHGSRTICFVVASPKSVVNKYIKVLNMAGLKLLSLETEIIALSRAIVGNNPVSPTSLIIQMGTVTTDFCVVSKGIILLTRSIATGGLSLTRAVSQHFNFEINQAEEYKKVYGLMEDQLEGKVLESLKPVIDIILSETKRVIQSFESKHPQNPIKRLVLSGGGR